jgi:serine/threonine-protein phosphatase 2A regulatory subunit B'
MVYHAMKLFMEINPQLFDDCSHEYTELQNSAPQREQNRKDKWDKLAELAEYRKNNPQAETKPVVNSGSSAADGSARSEEMDPITQDSQKRLNALKLQDESSAGRVREVERQNSVSPSQS